MATDEYGGRQRPDRTEENIKGRRREDSPFTTEELRGLAEEFEVDATQEVPEELRVLCTDLSGEQEHTLTTIRTGKGEHESPTSPHRPEWVGSILKPLAAPRLVPPRLQHHGVPVDPLVIWSGDDRRTYDDTRYPWGCVCRVLTRGSQGSGILVGPRHVLTASHVIDWDGPAETVEVHRAGGRVAATARAEAVWAYTQITKEPGGSTVDEDYAVIVTNQRLGDRFGWMGVRTYNSRWDDENFWWSIGYAGDVAGHRFPVWQRNKELDEDEFDVGGGRAMTTAADAMSGQSGSPMFGWWSDGPYVVAVMSAVGNVFLSGTENWCAGGTDLTRLVRHAREGDP